MIAALGVGTLIAMLALGYVLYPLLFPSGPMHRAVVRESSSGTDDAVVALREIEFDRATGKLSDSDYASLRARYVEEALGEMRRAESDVAAASELAASELAASELAASELAASELAATVAHDEPRMAPGLADDPTELRILAYRASHSSCPTCGIRPEAGASYCSECGHYLAGACAGCQSPIVASGAQYCSECGTRLAA